MLRKYFSYIDLADAIEDLNSVCEGSGLFLGNIHHQFTDSLSTMLCILADSATEDLPEDAWKGMPSEVLTTRVSALIENSLELISVAAEVPMPGPKVSMENTVNRLITLTIAATWGNFELHQKTALHVYQYDKLGWAIHKKRFAEAFVITELIAQTRGELDSIFAVHHAQAKQFEQLSAAAKARAHKRHAPTNKIKISLLAEWDESSKEYKSRADFCRIIARRDGIKERTLQEWIQAHQKKNL
ncbi:hypothetical protein RHM65_04515 [Pseudomonas sp. CCI4.2]|uniref:hypothetical protein n=1 Tax=Pseudomonas sp. CCI4.2 TaxID=3048620 RepID=UPI002AC8F144|nr:hypothetical protein [Pseudomonas sp. CCI4.2]MEB0091802.1 hypothetical protein [Pseudomonas sp. CCI4.2]WPX54847.1 hypothetical protein RHM65_04515 [Pseudomonas sp. CCI4.2]